MIIQISGNEVLLKMVINLAKLLQRRKLIYDRYVFGNGVLALKNKDKYFLV